MTQKWYNKASVQTALVTSVTLIIVTFSSIYFSDTKTTSNNKNINATNSKQKDTNEKRVKLIDLLVSVQKEESDFFIDNGISNIQFEFKMKNSTYSYFLINGLNFRVIRRNDNCPVEWFDIQTVNGLFPTTAEYKSKKHIRDITVGDTIKIPISQVIESNKHDRFIMSIPYYKHYNCSSFNLVFDASLISDDKKLYLGQYSIDESALAVDDFIQPTNETHKYFSI
jgi:hypothetical protein